MGVSTEFRSIYRHGFARVAACTTRCTLADPVANAAAILEVARACHQRGVALAVFPELGVSGYAISDLLHQSTLLDAVEAAVADLVAASADLLPLLLVGAPLRHAGALYNCALAIHRGRLLGVVPKVHLPNYREFYEPRHFVVGDGMVGGEIAIGALTAPFGTDLLFAAEDVPGLVVHAEICEDIWIPVPPSSRGGTGRRDGARQPVRQQHHDRQGGDAAPAVRLAIGALRGGLSVRRGRCGRVHHRSRLGRPGLDLRERCDAGRDRAFPIGQPVRDGRHRPRPAAPRAHADGQLRHQPPAPSRHVPPHRLPAGSAGRRYRSGAQGRALSVRAGRSRAARTGLLRGLQHPGLRPGAAAARDRDQARGDRRVGRARFHPRADRVRPRARPARAAARQHPRLHHARLRHLRAHQGERDPADGGARRHLAGARHPSRRRSAC